MGLVMINGLGGLIEFRIGAVGMAGVGIPVKSRKVTAGNLDSQTMAG